MKTLLRFRLFLRKLLANFYKILSENKLPTHLPKAAKEGAVTPMDLFIEDSSIRI